MADNTDRFGLNTYSDGDTNWTHNDVVQQVDELAIARGLASNRPSSGDYDGELYFAEDDLTLFKWDSNMADWSAVAGLGTDSAPLPQLSVEQDSLKVGGTTVENLFADAGHDHSGETINPDVTNADEFTLPSGWSLTENNSGEVVIENSSGSAILRWNESENEWVSNAIDANAVSAVALEAENTLTDPANVDHTGELADIDDTTRSLQATANIQSGDVNIDFTIPTGFNTYLVEGDAVGFVSDTTHKIQFSDDGGSTFEDSGYRTTYVDPQASDGFSDFGRPYVTLESASNTSTKANFRFYIFNANDPNNNTAVYGRIIGGQYNYIFAGDRNAEKTHDALRLSGNDDYAQGTVRFYGVN